MKLFCVAQFLPYPLIEGASICIFNRLDRLRARHDMTLFAPLRRPFDRDSLTFLRERGWTVETMSRPSRISGLGALTSRIKAFCLPIPMHWVMSWDEAIGLEMERQIRAHNPDVVMIEHLVTTRFLPYIRRATGAPLVFWDHNVEALWEAQTAKQFGLTFTGLLRRTQSGKVRRQEVKMLNTADMTMAISDHDRLLLQQMAPAAKVRVVPIGVDTAYFTPQPEAEEEDVIVFTGALNTGTNVDGMKFLVNDILPHILRQRPGVRVEIVGKEPTASILALADPPRVTIARDVPDVRPYMAKAAVFVVPIRPHSGVRLKILEGFAMGKATVSTGLAADGLDIEDGAHLLIRDDAPSFADAVVKLLEDKAERRRLAAAGRELVERDYSWESACAKLESHLEELLGAKVSGVG